MKNYVALTFAAPISTPGAQPEALAHAPDLVALAARLAALAPEASVEVFDGPTGLFIDGRPVCGVARGRGRAIFLCGPPAVAALARRVR